ncbi:uncharacterized protein LOC114276193 [Camellia sinensis]|uniref:uncharacterized protein LOC114276193 n=1 Tax=Camellia sinensis TaxID=4442 RepID=UPI001036B2AB|nr:uncharacterized protein LOC114276193 [Camellia sinensis]
MVCGIGVEEGLTKEFAKKLNCLSQKLPLTYLSLPLGANPRRSNTWKPVVEKYKKKLASWKRRYLSFAGRLTLIKSALSSLPVYFLSIFKMPVGVAKTIDRIQSNFLWGGSDIKKKIHLVKWQEVCQSTAQGGLGVRRLSEVNVCLMLKWWWRYGREHKSLWKQVVCCRFGGFGGRWTPEPVTDAMSAKESDWKLAFRRPLLAWEEEEVQRLHVFLSEAPNLNQLSEDSCLWMANPLGVFSVALVGKKLQSLGEPMVSISKFMWRNLAPPKAQFFSWLALEGEIED